MRETRRDREGMTRRSREWDRGQEGLTIRILWLWLSLAVCGLRTEKRGRRREEEEEGGREG
jgi:hypothetical protein